MKKSILGITGGMRFAVHDHPTDEPCGGYPACFAIYFSINALADSLIKATLEFANANIDHPDRVLRFFGGAFMPSSVPRLKECREIQRELRRWMTATSESDFGLGLSGPTYLGGEDIGGLADKSPEHAHIIAEPVVWEVDATTLAGNAKFKEATGKSIEFSYRFVHASLEDIVKYGQGFVMQEGLKERAGLCARDGCGNIFIDFKSRGTPRKYCKSKECDRILNAERVAKNREAKK